MTSPSRDPAVTSACSTARARRPLFEFQVFLGGGGPACATLPGAPTGLSAAGVSSASVTISWTAPNPGANCVITSYRVPGRRAGGHHRRPARSSPAWPPIPPTFTVVAVNSFGAAQSAALSVTTTGSSNPNFGPNVVIFDPSMPMSAIQSQINSIFAVQQNNQFGAPRTAMLFKPAPTTSTSHRILHPHHRPGRVP